MEDLISVVVPVYNVEDYLENCVKSICRQTYKNIEVILVDDGSTDRSGDICNDLAKIDNRIRVIHKKNGGLSEARNYGIDSAKGVYITFVDSDDYLSVNALMTLYSIAKSKKSDVAIGNLHSTNILNDKFQTKNKKIKKMNNIEALEEMFYANLFSTAAPAKLYKIELFNNVRFPVGKLYEDLYTIYKVIKAADGITYTTEVVYYYYTRPNSITQSEFSEKKLDALTALDFIKKEDFAINKKIKRALSSQYIEIVATLLSFRPPTYIIRDNNLWEIIKDNRKVVIISNKSNKRSKCFAIISYLGLNNMIKIMEMYYSRNNE